MKKETMFMTAVLLLFALMVQPLYAQKSNRRVKPNRQREQIIRYRVLPPVSLIQNDSLLGWTAPDGGPVKGNWCVQDGVLHCEKGKYKDIVTEKEYENYILDFQWKIDQGGNSGVKYRFNDFGEIGCKVNYSKTYGFLGCEYQLLDDAKNPENKNIKRTSGALYDIKEPAKDKLLNEPGQWNSSRIVVMGTKLEHWLNGKKVMDIRVGSNEWKERLAKSKFAEVEQFGASSKGRIMLQDHGDGISFRNLTIREMQKK